MIPFLSSGLFRRRPAPANPLPPSPVMIHPETAMQILTGAMRLMHPAYPKVYATRNRTSHVNAVEIFYDMPFFRLHCPLPHGDAWLPDVYVADVTAAPLPEGCAPYWMEFPTTGTQLPIQDLRLVVTAWTSAAKSLAHCAFVLAVLDYAMTSCQQAADDSTPFLPLGRGLVN